MNRAVLLTIFLFAVFSCGCAKLEELTGRGSSDREVPKSKATVEESAAIDTALEEISDLSEKFGPRQTFRKIPIVVTDHDMKKTTWIGLCSYAEPYIAINRAAFQQGLNGDTKLFNVLLHEIGHCYFDREHNSRTFYKKDHWVMLTSIDLERRSASSHSFHEICASAMCEKSRATGLKGPQMPPQLKEYYVGEIMGGITANELSDLERYVDIKFVLKPLIHKHLRGN